MLNLILLRLVRERRLMAMLLLSMCLVTGFLALGPLYVQAIAGADFDQRVENAAAVTFSLEVRDTQTLPDDTQTILRDRLGRYVIADRSYVAAAGFQLCGASIAPDSGERNNSHCYRPYGYPSFENVLTLVAGRFPEMITADTDDTTQVETVVAQRAIDETELEIGSRIALRSTTGDTIHAEIVGSFESALPAGAPFFATQTVLDTFQTPLPNMDSRTDISFIVPYEAYQAWYAGLAESSTYVVQADLKRDAISSQVVDDVEQRLLSFRTAITQAQPDAVVNTRFFELIEAFREGVNSAQGPITLLSFMVLVLMLYNIISTAGLILEQQAEEWAMIASRGGSALQLTLIQFVTVALLGVIAAAAGAFVAYGILAVLAVVGPQAAILDVTRLGGISGLSVLLSVVAAAITTLALTIPGWMAANNSLLRLKSGMSRPPEQATWARYYLDLILLGLGVAFLVRLYTLSTGESIGELARNPAGLIAVLSAGGAEGAFNDIFNLAGPALILVGASLLWMRLFPLLMRGAGALFAQGDGLTARLAFWNVERDPAHYAQLVLLLIGTLALGTASLALSHTREQGAWVAASEQTGADTALSLDAEDFDPDYDYGALPDVEQATPLLIVPIGNERDGALIGLDVDDASGMLTENVTALREYDAGENGGVRLPNGTDIIQLDIYAEMPEEDGTIEMLPAVEIRDHTGQTVIVPLSAMETGRVGVWVTYEADLREIERRPLRLMAVHLASRHSEVDEYVHGVYLDRLMAVDRDGNETLLDSFGGDTYERWQWDRSSRLNQILSSTAFTTTDEQSSEGDFSLRVRYRMNDAGEMPRPAIMTADNIIAPPLPVVVSETFAAIQGGRSRLSRPLQAGDVTAARLTVPVGESSSTLIELELLVAGVIDGFSGYPDDVPLVIGDLDALRYRLNTTDTSAQAFGFRPVYDVNTVWFDLSEREPSAAFEAAVRETPAFVDVTYAWTRYTEIQREPLANALTGMLFAGFWVSLALSLLDFGFYMAVTIRRRALSFATLQAIGWRERDLLNLLLVEQVAFIAPALVIGMVFGVILALLIVPFLGLVGALGLQLPWLSIAGLLLVLVLAFGLILRVAAVALRRLNVNEVMRFGE